MKLAIQPAPTPYREVDPHDVVVTRIDLVWTRSGHVYEAWGYLRSEMTLDFDSIGHYTADTLAVGIHAEPGPEYIVATKAYDEPWQAVGSLKRERPPCPVMRQIEKLMDELTKREQNQQGGTK